MKHDFLHGQEVSNEFLLEAKERANERFRRLIAERRRDPRDDLLTHLVNAQIEGQPLTEEELLGICQLMVVAGLDTVTDSLTCFYAWLAGQPEQRRRIVEDPAIIPAAIEELLRFESPVPFVPRIVTEDLELSGCPLKAGNQVVCLLGSANTDERVHERADVVDFDREVNRHFGFGGGSTAASDRTSPASSSASLSASGTGASPSTASPTASSSSTPRCSARSNTSRSSSTAVPG